jgi:hypothetical protein
MTKEEIQAVVDFKPFRPWSIHTKRFGVIRISRPWQASVQGENIKVAQPTVSNAAEFVMIPFGDILEIKLQPVS